MHLSPHARRPETAPAGRWAVLLANGITVEQMVELVRAGLATATPQRIRAGREVMEVAVVRITDAGWKALAAKA